MTRSVLIITTSTGILPGDRETGFDWASIAAPYLRLREAGVHVGFASVSGGKPPGDASTAEDAGGDQIGAVSMFLSDGSAVESLARSERLAEIDPRDWTALLFVDGLGALWDVAPAEATADLVAAAWERGAVLAAIGAGTAALTVGRDTEGHAIAAGRSVTCMSDAAIEAALGSETPPILPETRLRAQGAQVWIAAEADDPYVIEDGRLITGQDGRVAAGVALQLLEALDIYIPADVGEEDEEAERPGGRHAPSDGEGPEATRRLRG